MDIKTMYHVGDKVVVRSDLSHGVSYKMQGADFGLAAVEDMYYMAGAVAVITGVYNDEFAGPHYTIWGSSWKWTDEMFSGRHFDDFDDGLDNADTSELMAFINELVN